MEVVIESDSDESVVFVDMAIDNKQAIDNETLSESDSHESPDTVIDNVPSPADPFLYEELRQIALRYKEWKRIEADEGDTQGIPCPYPQVVGGASAEPPPGHAGHYPLLHLSPAGLHAGGQLLWPQHGLDLHRGCWWVEVCVPCLWDAIQCEFG